MHTHTNKHTHTHTRTQIDFQDKSNFKKSDVCQAVAGIYLILRSSDINKETSLMYSGIFHKLTVCSKVIKIKIDNELQRYHSNTHAYVCTNLHNGLVMMNVSMQLSLLTEVKCTSKINLISNHTDAHLDGINIIYSLLYACCMFIINRVVLLVEINTYY